MSTSDEQPLFEQLRDAIRAESPVALATVVEGEFTGAKLIVHPDEQLAGTLGNTDLDRVVARDARGELAAGRSGVRHYGLHGEAREGALSVFIGELGERDAICILTHDAKFDVPAVVSALKTDVGYIGVMGSRRTHDDRTKRLIEAGVDEAGLARLRSPIGLDIGARTPEETAVSITAEIIGRRTGRDAKSLTVTEGPIHG